MSSVKNFLPDFFNKQFGLPWVIIFFITLSSRLQKKKKKKPNQREIKWVAWLITGNSVGLYGNKHLFHSEWPYPWFPSCSPLQFRRLTFHVSLFGALCSRVVWCSYVRYRHNYTYACMCVQKHKPGISFLFWALSSLLIEVGSLAEFGACQSQLV